MLRSTIPEARRPTDHRHDRQGRGAERPIPVSIFTKEPPGPIPDKGPSPYQTMEDPFMTEAGVLKLLQNIKVDKATGPDAIAARVMRETAVDLAPVLTTISTHSIKPSRYLMTGRRQMSSRYSRKAQSTLPPTTDPSLSPVSPAK